MAVGVLTSQTVGKGEHSGEWSTGSLEVNKNSIRFKVCFLFFRRQ